MKNRIAAPIAMMVLCLLLAVVIAACADSDEGGAAAPDTTTAAAVTTDPQSTEDMHGAENDYLDGIYLYGDVTSFSFDGKGSGSFRTVIEGEAYQFDYTYRIEGNQLFLDFESENAHDATYAFSLNGDCLTLVGGEGSGGGRYELVRQYVAD